MLRKKLERKKYYFEQERTCIDEVTEICYCVFFIILNRFWYIAYFDCTFIDPVKILRPLSSVTCVMRHPGN